MIAILTAEDYRFYHQTGRFFEIEQQILLESSFLNFKNRNTKNIKDTSKTTIVSLNAKKM
jgi:hypothetical protein